MSAIAIFSSAVTLIVLLIIWEFMFIFLARVIIAIVVIVTTELIKAVLVEKVTIRVIET